MFSCRTKLENYPQTISKEFLAAVEKIANVIVLEVGAQNGAAEFAHIRHDETAGNEVGYRVKACDNEGDPYLVPSSVQVMNCDDFGALIILQLQKKKTCIRFLVSRQQNAVEKETH